MVIIQIRPLIIVYSTTASPSIKIFNLNRSNCLLHLKMSRLVPGIMNMIMYMYMYMYASHSNKEIIPRWEVAILVGETVNNGRRQKERIIYYVNIGY